LRGFLPLTPSIRGYLYYGKLKGDPARTKEDSSPYSPQRREYLPYGKLIVDLKTHSPLFYVKFPTTHFLHTI
jgi:hypothetical protein